MIDRASEIGRRGHLPRVAAYASLLRAESQLQADWLGQGSFDAAEIDALTGEMETYVRDAGGVVDRADLSSIVSQHHLHRRRWHEAAATTLEQLNNAVDTEDPILMAEAILMSAAVLAHIGRMAEARDAVRVAGPAFTQWAAPIWLAFTIHPADDLYPDASKGRRGPIADAEQLISVSAAVSTALQEVMQSNGSSMT